MTRDRAPSPLPIRPRPSRHLAGLLLGLHGATLALILALPWPWPWRIALAGTTLVGLSYQMAVHIGRRMPWAIREAVWHADGSWSVTLANGRQLQAELAPSTFVAVGLIVLDLRSGHLWRGSLPLLPDSLDPEHGRRLRARLRLGGPEGRS